MVCPTTGTVLPVEAVRPLGENQMAGRASSALETDVQYITKHIKAQVHRCIFGAFTLREHMKQKKEVENKA